MKAIGFNQPLPISDERSLVDIELPDPEPGPNDLLVAVEAIAVNPADTKVRASARPAAGSWRILGWDAVGTVRAVGRDVSGVVCGRGRNPTLRLWPAIFSGEIDVFPSERRNMGQEIGR